MLAYKTPNTSTPESHLQGTPYKSTDLSVVLDPLGADPNSLGIMPQLVKSPELFAFRVMSVNTDL